MVACSRCVPDRSATGAPRVAPSGKGLTTALAVDRWGPSHQPGCLFLPARRSRLDRRDWERRAGPPWRGSVVLIKTNWGAGSSLSAAILFASLLVVASITAAL